MGSRHQHPRVGLGDQIAFNRWKGRAGVKFYDGFIRQWVVMLFGPIGGRRRYRALHKFLISRGWELDTECGDPCWTYPPAYGGAAVALNRANLDVPDLADLGPLRPTVYLAEDDTTVYSHGTFKGCDHHREQRSSIPHRSPDDAQHFRAVIAEVEHAARLADARPYQDCVVAGPCGAWLRQWYAEGGPWPGQRT